LKIEDVGKERANQRKNYIYSVLFEITIWRRRVSELAQLGRRYLISSKDI
jgi:hypothetical protein